MGDTRKNYDGMYLLRALACFLVVLSHSVNISYYSYASEYWLPAITYTSCIRVAVPLFLMISGYLLLDKWENILVFYKKRSKRVLPPFFFYLVFYYVLICLYTGAPFSLYAFLQFVADGGTGQMWYLYLLIGVYAFMPFLRLIYQGASSQEKWIFCGMWLFVSGLVPLVFGYFGITYNFAGKFALYQFVGHFGYVFIGAWLKHLHLRRSYSFLAVYFLCTGMTLYLTCWYSYPDGDLNNIFQNKISPLIVVATLSVFVAFKDTTLGKFSSVIKEIAANSFGIYLLHVAVIAFLRIMHINGIYGYPWIMHPLTAILATTISFFAIKYAKKIPYMKFVAG